MTRSHDLSHFFNFIFKSTIYYTGHGGRPAPCNKLLTLKKKRWQTVVATS